MDAALQDFVVSAVRAWHVKVGLKFPERNRARTRPITAESIIAGIASGEFDHVPDVNDALLDLVGYSREDLAAGRMPICPRA